MVSRNQRVRDTCTNLDNDPLSAPRAARQPRVAAPISGDLTGQPAVAAIRLRRSAYSAMRLTVLALAACTSSAPTGGGRLSA